MKIKPRLDLDWKKEMMDRITELKNAKSQGFLNPKEIEFRTTFGLAKQWLVMRLSEKAIPFQFKNLGAGVSLITTDIDKCPMCKKPLLVHRRNRPNIF